MHKVYISVNKLFRSISINILTKPQKYFNDVNVANLTFINLL